MLNSIPGKGTTKSADLFTLRKTTQLLRVKVPDLTSQNRTLRPASNETPSQVACVPGGFVGERVRARIPRNGKGNG